MKNRKLKINFSIFNFNENHLDGRPTDRAQAQTFLQLKNPNDFWNRLTYSQVVCMRLAVEIL